MAKDSIGNELAIDDLVQVVMPTTHAIGSVVAIEAGGILVPGGQRGPKENHQQHVTAGKVKVLVELDVAYFPQTGICAELLKLAVPKEVAETMAQRKKKGLHLTV